MQKHVMLVEDNSLHRKLFTFWLETGGYTVTALEDEREAETSAIEMLPDVMIVDIRLPFINGLDIISALKANASVKHIPIMAITVLNWPRDKEACLSAGADDYMAKPAVMETFMERVGALCA